jgi:hypothetical protein
MIAPTWSARGSEARLTQFFQLGMTVADTGDMMPYGASLANTPITDVPAVKTTTKFGMPVHQDRAESDVDSHVDNQE